MSKKVIHLRSVLFILLMIFSDPHTVSADGLPPEEALPTETPEEPAAPSAEENTPEPVVDSAPLAKPLTEPKPAPAPKEDAAVPSVTSAPSSSELWSSFFHGTIISDPKPEGRIVASKDLKMMLGEGDTVYLRSFSNEFVPGKEWVVYRVIKNVYHPKTRKYLGDLIDVTGIVKITEVDKKMATAEITRSKEPISKNDHIASIETLFNLSSPANRALPEGMTATIIESRENRLHNATHDIVYIDRGKKDGVVRGDRFSIIGGGGQSVADSDGETLGLPERDIGSIRILSSQDHTATGQIVQSSETVSKGNALVFHFLK